MYFIISKKVIKVLTFLSRCATYNLDDGIWHYLPPDATHVFIRCLVQGGSVPVECITSLIWAKPGTQ